MNHEDPTNVQLALLNASLEETDRKIDDNAEVQNEKLDRIQAQVSKTNGRVSALENWRWFVVGGLTVISLVVIPLLFVLLKGKF